MDSYFKLCYSPLDFTSRRRASTTPILPNATFTVWYNNDFGLCFEYLTFSAFLGALFGVVSALYAGCNRSRLRRKIKPSALVVRGLISSLILVTFIVDFVGGFWLSPGRPYSVLLSLCIQMVAWTVHVCCLWVLSCSVTHYGRGPLNLCAAWLLTFVGSILNLRTTIRWKMNHEPYMRSSLPLEEAYFSDQSVVLVYVVFSLQCLYGISLLLKVRKVTGTDVGVKPFLFGRSNQRRVEWTDDAEKSVQQHLVSSEFPTVHAPSSYGAIPHQDVVVGDALGGNRFGNLDAVEDDANLPSLLSFWWVEPLMKRGALGFLRNPEDLLKLPKSLSTSKMREKFQKSRKRNLQKSGVHQVEASEHGQRKVLVTRGNVNGTRSTGYKDEDSCGDVSGREVDSDNESWYDSMSQSAVEGVLEDSKMASSPDDGQMAGEGGLEEGEAESIFWSLNKAFGLHFYPLGVLKLLADIIGFAGPLLLHALVSFMENRTEPMSHGYYYALGLFLSTLLGAMLITHFNYQVNKVGLKIRAAVITEVYRKALSVSTTTLSKFSTGQVVNFMSTDSDRIVNFCNSFHQFWSLPFQVIVSLALLYQQVGLAFLTGLGFCILLVPINRWLALKIGKLSTEMMAQKDQRVKVMTEILAGIRVIKFYAWENCFIQRIQAFRSLELKSLKGRKYLDALCVYFWATTPVLISILTFATYIAMGHTLTAAKVFTSVALFNILISPLNAFPWVINGLMEAWVSAKRVNKFLQLKELDISSYYYDNQLPAPASSRREQQEGEKSGGEGLRGQGGEGEGAGPCLEVSEGVALSIRDGHFVWTDSNVVVKDDDKGDGEAAGNDGDGATVEWRLQDINISIKPGQLIGVVGKVGSGKTSLLSAITAEMCKVYGEVNVADLREGFGLFAQESWIQHATVKENILFGQPYDAAKYTSVIAATAMEQDLRILAAGDETEVGENGVTLSGGQKARIALARAIYQDKSIYLLDDPLAAVDAHVASHLFQQCIVGLLKEKTRIVCTHHVRFLQDADVIIFMVDGQIQCIGQPADVLPLVETEQVLHVASLADSENGPSTSSRTVKSSEEEITEEASNQVADNVLVKEEEKEVGVVAFSVFLAYWSAVGLFLAPTILFALLLMQVSRNINDWWLSYWITHSSNSSNSSDLGFYLGIYGGLAASNSVFTLFRAFLYAYGGVCAATVLHTKLLKSIIMAPISFFDTTPIGRIVNRFSSDIYAIDDSLPFILNILLAQLYGLLGTLVITCYGLPWFTILLLPLGLLYYHIQHFYRRTSRELKRLSTVTLSPVYAHFSETLTGLCTIRALRATDRFMRDNEEKLEVNQRANYGSYAVAQWLGIRLQMLGVVMVAGVAFIAVLEHHFNSVNPGLVGLAISYALSVTNLLGGVVSSFTETEKEMVCVERAMQYIRGTPTERREASFYPSPTWPSQGVLEFRNVVLSYRTTLPSALKRVSFKTLPGEKIGVVGRTGAGKSSLFKAIFRVVELSGGEVFIDGINIADIALERLRSSVAIIPQDPFLFSGSLRENLDPCIKHNDGELWSVLEKCHLKDAVVRLGGLECEVGERGRVFSAGQCQLVCLARALLTKARLIFIDEATASVDQQTDTEIQHTLRSEFTSSTVITIAHRIETVLQSDRILVMEHGTVKELASPDKLLDDHDSLFYSLYREYHMKSSSSLS